MRKRVSVLLGHLLQSFRYGRVALKLKRTRVDDLLRERERFVELGAHSRRLSREIGVQFYEMS